MNLEDYLNDYMKIGKDQQKSYSVKSYKDNEELFKILKKFLKTHDVGMKACFHNSALLMKADPRIGYCEGYISLNMGDGLPIEHAWNVFDNDFYFDITSEELFMGNIGKGHNKYIELYRTMDKLEAKKIVMNGIRPYMRRRK